MSKPPAVPKPNPRAFQRAGVCAAFLYVGLMAIAVATSQSGFPFFWAIANLVAALIAGATTGWWANSAPNAWSLGDHFARLVLICIGEVALIDFVSMYFLK